MKVYIQEENAGKPNSSLIIAIPIPGRPHYLQMKLFSMPLLQDDDEMVGIIKQELVYGEPDYKEMKAMKMPEEMAKFFFDICGVS